MQNNTLTALGGVSVGHSTHLDRLTGCTVVLFDQPMPVAYQTYGGAPGTFNTDLLKNGKSFNRRHGLFVAGGSLTGLMSATSIMQAMIDDGIGFKDGKMTNPSVSGAVVYDLGVSIDQFNPLYGEEAYHNANYAPVPSGNVGAGTGTAVGKFYFLDSGTKNGGMKAGIGNAMVSIGEGIKVSAMSVVNALGNIVLQNGATLAGNRDEKNGFKQFTNLTDYVTNSRQNTTITIVGINVDLKTRENYERLALFGSHGQVRAIKPVNTSVDGDTVFVFSTEEIKKPLNNVSKYFETPNWPYFTVDIIGNAVAEAVQESVYDACHSSSTVKFEYGYKGVIPAASDYN